MDFEWRQLPEALAVLEQDPALQLHYARTSQRLAQTYLSPSAARCYWRRLLELAAERFPAPQLDARAVPFDVLLALGADRSLTDPDGCSALGCYRQTQRDSNDFMATMGIGARRGANLALEAKLTPPAGPTAADADAELE